MKQPKELSIMIMDATLELIKSELSELERGDPTKLNLVEFYPRSEDFADRMLSLSISTNDPKDQGGWEDVEITKWPPKQDPYSQDYGKNFGEMGGGQGFSLRFVLMLRLYYNEMGTSREKAIAATRIIMARIKTAILRDRKVYRSLRDDFGAQVLVWHKAVKKMESLPAGSAEETFTKAKMYLQFEVYQE